MGVWGFVAFISTTRTRASQKGGGSKTEHFIEMKSRDLDVGSGNLYSGGCFVLQTAESASENG